MSDEEENILKGIKHFSTITQDSEVRDLREFVERFGR